MEQIWCDGEVDRNHGTKGTIEAELAKKETPNVFVMRNPMATLALKKLRNCMSARSCDAMECYAKDNPIGRP